MLLKVCRLRIYPRSITFRTIVLANMSAEMDGAPSKSSAKKEAKRLEKEAKLAAKQLKQAASTPVGEKKAKAEKESKTDEPAFVNTTPKGEKKDLSQPMAAGYNPQAVEAAWYDWWEAQGFFKPQLTQDGLPKPEGVFVVPFPPPNVTGSLHIGHALTVAIQDGLIRWNRMLGKTTLFVPGFDHAGISTQSVVERRLFKQHGKTRHDLGREAFLDKVMDWKNDYQSRITNQLRRLGGSFDWDRVAFTMNPSLSKAVIENFCQLHEGGILYRDNRLVNWCVRLNTTLSNLEVDQKQLEGKTLLNVPGYDPKEKFEFGVITSFAYPIEDSDEKLIVATTRPETMLGDSAIAVHPEDDRYKHLHGKFAKHPFVDRRLPIVADDMVDKEFGTGAVKITPAHDPNDYEVGKRHNLDFISILNDDGTLNANAGDKFNGMKRLHARNEVVKALTEAGLFIETKDNPMQIPICSKSGDIIEPILKPQWWVRCKPLAEEAIKRSRAGELKIAPAQSEADWYRWLDNIQDWCISRQLWWGHRCPAYLVRIEGEENDINDGKNWVVGRTLEEATKRAEVLAAGRSFTLDQDEDVLDTWFSSALWPFSIMGWPDKTADLEHYYPSSLLETGWDILFFWVARMVPFGEVLCHAMIRDAHGRKMSKSLGNVIDPLDIIRGLPLQDLHQKLYEGNLDDREIAKAVAGQKKDFPKGIPECGTDGLRFALCAYSGGGRDINLEILRVEGYRKFCNKIFNATKFAMLKFEPDFVPIDVAKLTRNESLVERWVLHKLNFAAGEVNRHLEARNFMAATTAAYNFWLYELCDVYIEATKPMTDPLANPKVRTSAQQTLHTCLDHGLRLLHPFMPFVTEELWQRLPRRSIDPPSIMVSRYPTFDTDLRSTDAEEKFDLVFAALRTGRSLAASYNLQSNIQLFIHVQTSEEKALFESQVPTVIALTKGCSKVEVIQGSSSQIPAGCGSAVVSSTVVVYLQVQGLVNLEAEVAKCDKKIDLARLNLDKLHKVISHPDYQVTVPEAVQFGNEEKRKTLEVELAALQESREMFVKLR
ncbi:tRNA synthetases class I-domain-containing protein [Boletus coccyginus]|nr:tRNA synthetases class I-domain-containing protein [Boletus coccyginus]